MASSSDPSIGGGASAPDTANSSQPNRDQEIHVDHTIGRDDDLDSTLGSESSSLRSTSLTSSIYNYRYENGRRYHAYRDGRYVFPNDEAEQDRLDFHHHLWRLMIGGKLFHAPISSQPQRVLDLGTGTGIWSIDFADEFPSALIIGTDLSPIQPSSVPPNCKFYVDDFESEWTFNPEEAFDFIHGRALAGNVKDFDLLYHRIYENLKPGGWLEMQEYQSGLYSDDDPSLSKAPNFKKWTHLCNEASERAGFLPAIAEMQRQKILDAGFIDVHEDVYKMPTGTWPKDRKQKELGLYHREHVVLGLEAFTPGLLGRVLGWSEEEYKILISQVRQELRDPKLHLYSQFRFTYGRRQS